MAVAGQGAKQAPQPLHDSPSICGSRTPPGSGRKAMARGSHWSPQIRHSTPRKARQDSDMRARSADFTVVACISAPGSQARTQSPHSVHSPRLKSSSARPSRSATMPLGQALTQSPQALHRSTKFASGNTFGGRVGGARRGNSARRKRRRSGCTRATPTVEGMGRMVLQGGSAVLDGGQE